MTEPRRSGSTNRGSRSGLPARLFPWSALAAAVLVVALQGLAIERQSLTGDAAYHLLAGHQALRYGRNLLNLEHPPLAKLVASLPLLAEEPLAPSITVDKAIETSRRLFDDPALAQRTRRRSRTLLLAAFGLPFLVAVFCFGRRWGGPRTGGLLALSLGLSLSTLPHLTIVQTDTAVSLGVAWLLVAALRYLVSPGKAAAALMGTALGLALASKYSAVLFLPVPLLAVVMARRPSWTRRLGDLALAAATSAALVWIVYGAANLRYDREAGRDTIRRYCRNEALIVDDRMEPWEETLLAVEKIDPYLAQWLTGLVGIRIQNQIGVYPTYAFGSLSTGGRWWYFPAVLLIKTPLVLLLGTGLALATALRARKKAARTTDEPAADSADEPPRPAGAVALVALTAGLYLAVAMSSSYNLGVRHLLPILPLIYLPAARWTARSRGRTLIVGGLLAIEALAVAPLWMSATHTWWLGNHNPSRFALSIGSLEYRQNFLVLAGEARRRGIDRLHVVYPMIDHDELRASVPRAVVVEPGAPIEPGWYAVSVAVEQFLPAIRRSAARDPGAPAALRSLAGLERAWSPIWTAIAAGEDHGWVAGTFHLYRVTSRDGSRPGHLPERREPAQKTDAAGGGRTPSPGRRVENGRGNPGVTRPPGNDAGRTL